MLYLGIKNTSLVTSLQCSGVESYDVRLPVSSVPVQETTYICYQFQFPMDTVNDVIAFEPIIDNSHIVHHMRLLVCVDKPLGEFLNR